MVSPRSLKLLALFLLLLILLLLFSLFFFLFYCLSYIFHWYGSLFLFLLFLYLLLRFAVSLLVFPGSCWFWQRSIEANLCVEMTHQVFYKLRELRLYLQAIQNQERAALNSNTPVLVDSLAERLAAVGRQQRLSSSQQGLLSRLEALKSLLQETLVVVDSQHSRSLWDYLLQRVSHGEARDVVYEDYPDCSQAKKIVSLCEAMENSLLQSCGTVKFTKKVRRWLTDNTLGSIHYLREDLLKRFPCEQVWVQSEGVKVDWY
jgi:hypothetical protein